MTSINEPASATASSATQQTQAEARTTSIPDITELSLEHNPDIFTIICCNDSFQLALDHSTIKALLRVCKRARPLLSFKLPCFNTWCQMAGLCHPDGQMRIGLTPSETIALSLHCENQYTGSQSWLAALADQGNASASYILARVLQVKLFGPSSTNKPKMRGIARRIMRYLRKAADAGHPKAKFYLAGCYHDGIVTNRDHTKAVELYCNVADRGMAQAQVALGRCYELGEGVDQDINAAIEWYSKAEDQGSEDGRLHIVFLRGWRSFLGDGVEQSDADAFHHWQEVSDLSTDPIHKSIATHMLGWMHYLGRGTVRDEQKGVKIIRKNRSNVFKLREDECLASYTWGTKSGSTTARTFFELCQLGSDRDWLCKHLTAVCLVNGFGTTEDRVKAAGIFEQLANDSHSDSQLWIGECYRRGGGVSEDHEKAFEWYNKAASQGNSYGHWMVGTCYYFGQGVAHDETKALEWFRRSADQDNRYGQYHLGNCYRDGYGVDADINTAVLWYRKSANQGCDLAIDRLKWFGKWP